jgi:predicted transcriptional regulator
MPTNNELDTTKSLYEVLIRLDGPRIAGAHCRYKVRVLDDGVLISSTVGSALPLSLDNKDLAAVLDEAVITALAENMDLQGKLKEALTKIEQLETKIKKLAV